MNLYDVVMELRNLVTVMMQIEKDLKFLLKQKEPNKNGGSEK